MFDFNIDLLMAACFTAGFGFNCLIHRFTDQNTDILMFIAFLVVVLGCFAFLPNF